MASPFEVRIEGIGEDGQPFVKTEEFVVNWPLAYVSFSYQYGSIRITSCWYKGSYTHIYGSIRFKISNFIHIVKLIPDWILIAQLSQIDKKLMATIRSLSASTRTENSKMTNDEVKVLIKILWGTDARSAGMPGWSCLSLGYIFFSIALITFSNS